MKMAQNADNLKDSGSVSAYPGGAFSATAALSRQCSLALEYARGGLPVEPRRPVDKSPLTPHGKDDATTDLEHVRNMWRRFPDALVSTPTGDGTRIWVLDIDRGGERHFGDVLRVCDCETIEDLSPAWVTTPSGGTHVYFRLEPGTSPRTRSSDIAPNIDTRGLGGSIILPGNELPDGRGYRWRGRDSATIFDAPSAPRPLLWLATFNSRERDTVTRTPELAQRLRMAEPTQWLGVFEEWRREEAEKIAARHTPRDDGDGMRRQALHDLRQAVAEYAALSEGRRQRLFTLACRVARYAVHGVITENEFRSAFMDAARANGAVSKHGPQWAVKTLRSAITCAANDTLPPLARAFRSEVSA